MFDVPDQVEWSRVAEALNRRWILNNELGLSHESTTFLGTKLFPGKTSVVLRCGVCCCLFFLSFDQRTERVSHANIFGAVSGAA